MSEQPSNTNPPKEDASEAAKKLPTHAEIEEVEVAHTPKSPAKSARKEDPAITAAKDANHSGNPAEHSHIDRQNLTDAQNYKESK